MPPETAIKTLKCEQFNVKRFIVFFLDQDNSKISKKHLGSESSQTCGFVIPTIKADSLKHAIGKEGLEDALSLREHFPDSSFYVGTDKAGLKRLEGFLCKFQKVLIFADHDEDGGGQYEALNLANALRQSGVHEVGC